MGKPRTEQRQLTPAERRTSFAEVRAGFRAHQALQESSRCLYCDDAPCVAGCPCGVGVEKFIRRIKTNNLKGAWRVLLEVNPLPGSCARVCPHALQCEGRCNREELGEPINIGALQRFVADEVLKGGARAMEVAPDTGRRVAVFGAGPAGLAVASRLRRLGHAVEVFEAREAAGGLLAYGIPSYRLPKDALRKEVEVLEKSGIVIHTGHPMTPDDGPVQALDRGFDACCVAVGLGRAYRTGIPGSGGPGTYVALDLLRSVNAWQMAGGTGEPPVRLEGRVVVIGGGNVAMDAAGIARRLGATEVHVTCLEARDEMPAFPEEVAFAKEEGVVLHHRLLPKEVLRDGDGRVTGLRLHAIEWREPGRYVPANAVEVPGGEQVLPADFVIEAIGQGPSPELPACVPGAATVGPGYLAVDPETRATAVPGIFACGEVVTGGSTVARAMADGNRAADAIHAYLSGGAAA